MIRKTFLLIVFFLVGIVLAVSLFNKNAQKNRTQRSSDPSINSKFEGEVVEKESLFVPYWSLDQLENLGEYDRLIYFGVTANTEGINESEQGYLALETFLDSVPVEQEKYLTLRMIDSDTNFAILKSEEAQRKVISDAVDVALSNGFRGVVLDLELFSLFDDSLPGQITNFVQKIDGALQNSDLTLAVAIYGDVYYRKRPFDVKQIAQNSNEIMVMAYDFHKSAGLPGPNFPLLGHEKFGYDYEVMISDFLGDVPPEKLTVIFGMYGYEWEVDEKRRPYKTASSLTLNQIREKYLGKCTFKNCVVLPDKEAAESEINFVGDDGRLHIIWFENEDSVKAKKEFLKSQGIGGYAYWAAGYF